MKTTITEKDGKVTVAVVGELDTDTSKIFQNDTAPLLDRNGLDVQLDFAKMEYISSKALRVLISFKQRITAQGGSVEIINILPSVLEVFDMTGLTKSFIKG